MRLSGAIALVTGGSSGIGAATARSLAAAGARVLVSGRDPARLRAVAGEVGGVALPADLAEPGAAGELATAALRAAAELAPAGGPGTAGQAGRQDPAGSDGPAGGRIDILVNNAGIGWAGPLHEIPAGKVTELVAVNLTAPIELTRLLLPGMTEHGRGRIVFVSSIAGATGVRGEAVYSATKAGLGFLAESLAYELDGRDVRVSVVVPGVIETPFFDRRGKPYGRRRPGPLPPGKVAEAILRCLERDRDVVYVPAWMRLPAWLHGSAPGTFRRLAARFGDPG